MLDLAQHVTLLFCAQFSLEKEKMKELENYADSGALSSQVLISILFSCIV